MEAEIAAARRRSVLEAAKRSGLFDSENSILGARVPSVLITRAKERTGITSTTDLVEYALAKLALEDDFGAKLVARSGSIPPNVTLDV